MKKINTLLVGAMLLASTAVNAQKWAIDKTLSFLQGQKEINIQYSYDRMTVGNAGLEADYISGKVADLNKKEPGKGDKWAAGWKSAPTRAYEPKFETLLNSKLGDVGVTAGQNKTGAKYTLIVHTTSIEPGFNVGVMKKPAYCDFELTFVDSKNPGTVLARAILKNVVGSQAMGYDFDVASRVQESYAKAGKMCGKSMLKALKAKK